MVTQTAQTPKGHVMILLKATCGICRQERMYQDVYRARSSLYQYGWRNKQRYGWICPDCNATLHVKHEKRRAHHRADYIASIAQDVIEMYLGGMTIQEIAEKTHVHSQTLSKIIKEHGIEVPRGRRYGKSGKGLLWTGERVDELLEMRFGQHMTTAAIGKSLGISRERVRQIIGNTGYITRKKYQRKLPKNSQRFHVIEWLEAMRNDPAMAEQCWTLPFYVNKNGYGWLRSEGENVYAHIFAFEYFGGTHTPNMQLRHACKNKACCNPKHLVVKYKKG